MTIPHFSCVGGSRTGTDIFLSSGAAGTVAVSPAQPEHISVCSSNTAHAINNRQNTGVVPRVVSAERSNAFNDGLVMLPTVNGEDLPPHMYYEFARLSLE